MILRYNFISSKEYVDATPTSVLMSTYTPPLPYHYKKVPGFSLFVEKDLANRWTDMVLFYMILERFITILGEGLGQVRLCYI